MHLAWWIDLILMVVAFVAAAIDTIAGGGGLITVPTLLLCGLPPVLTLGTIKLQAVIAEFSATLFFLRKTKIDYTVIFALLSYTALFAALGVVSLKLVPVHFLEKIIPFFLLIVLIYYIVIIRRKYHHYNEIIIPNQRKFLYLGSSIGFYNGFFGPGTGSIWAVALMRVFKLNIQRATMYAKPLNCAGNFAALIIFMYNRDVIYSLALFMCIGAFGGARFGAKIVVHKDLSVLKLIFLAVMSISVISTFIKFYG